MGSAGDVGVWRPTQLLLLIVFHVRPEQARQLPAKTKSFTVPQTARPAQTSTRSGSILGRYLSHFPHRRGLRLEENKSELQS